MNNQGHRRSRKEEEERGNLGKSVWRCEADSELRGLPETRHKTLYIFGSKSEEMKLQSSECKNKDS